jgi:subtilisin-like proprotein convertase family protein
MAACGGGGSDTPLDASEGETVDAAPPDSRPNVEICDNEFEDDGDGFIDCDDTDCALDPYCAAEVACGDDEDNDHDDFVDCDDPDCATAVNCLPEGLCSNGSDDDLDGDVDCEDDDCELFCLVGCIDGESLVTIPATGLPQTVDNPTDVVVDFAVNATGLISGAAVHFSIDHSFPADLDIMLRAPNGGPELDLTSDNGSTGQNYTDTYIGAGASAPITTGGAPFTGRFLPEQSFNGVTGLPALGTWQVVVHDDFPSESGVVQSMELYVCVCDGTDGCESQLACVDGQDNDGDTLVDCLDTADCGGMAQCIPETICDDDQDSDLDGLFDCQDPDCVGIGFCELPETSCSDGNDNDGDLTTDCADTSCDNAAYCLPEADCFDGTDDDNDGLADCLDIGCNGVEGCELGTEVSCNDGLDNDGDTLTDCADSNCAGLLLCSGTTCPAGTIATNRRASGLPIPIPDVQTTTSTIPFARPGLVKMVAVKIDANHTYDSDLDIYLDAPGGTVELSTDNGTSLENFTQTVFIDSAANPITAGTPPFTGSFRPETPFSNLIGRPAPGNYTLRITDDLGGDFGTLNAYEVLLCQCDAASGDCEFGPACRNGSDDDGDAVIDCAETSCATDPFCIPETACNNGLDEDLDGLIDCDDPNCDGIQNCEFGTEDTCNDHLDNDSDTAIDCADTDCTNTAHCLPETDCNDGIDDDNDGLMDCLDVGCNGLDGCELGTELTCNDGFDNDGDTLSDCADPNCSGQLYCNATCPAGMESRYQVALDNPQPILDNATIRSTIPIPVDGKVQQVAVKVDALHTFDADVDMFLEAPGGTVELSTDNGGGNDNYTNTIFMDSAATAITAGVAPYTGSFRPEQPLGNLAQTSMIGDWKLRVTDDAAALAGTLNKYEVLVCYCDPAGGSCEFGTECRNGVDNDNDTLIDCADPNCATDPFCIPESACNDNVDNDLDGLKDCLDPNCDGIQGCQLGTELNCTDNFDNDADGPKDCFDTDCAADPACQIELNCNNGLDDDGNGTSDCADAACATSLWCLPESDCTDGTDNDGDGVTDCADVGCNGVQGCVLAPESGCEDGVDNDADLTTDCTDQDCALWCSIASCPAGSHKVQYRAGGLPLAMPDNGQIANPAIASITPNVSGVVSQVAVRVDVTHTNDADVDMFLNTPNGLYELSTDNGSTNDNYVRTIFLDAAATAITAGVAPYTGSFRSEWPLSGLVSYPSSGGTWQLWAADDLAVNTGTLNRFELMFCQCDNAAGNCEVGPYACRNGVDDDGNGFADCLDPGCATDPVCVTPPPASEHACSDTLDDDGDGQTDCADSDCAWLCGTLGSVCTSPRQLYRYGTVDMPKPIAAVSPFLVNSPFRVPVTGTIYRAAVRFNAAHTFVGDVQLSMGSPGGVILDLTSGNGGSGDNYVDTILVDTAAGTIGTTNFNTAPFTGKYRPEQPLSLLAFEQAAGLWWAQVRDTATSDGGNWTEFSLGLCVIP